MRKLSILLALPFLGLAAWLALGFPAMAATAPVITEFPVPTVFGQPLTIAAGPDGAMWFTGGSTSAQGVANYGIGRITVGASPAITTFPFVTAGDFPYEIVSGPDGNLWFTEYPITPPGTGQIGRITPGPSPSVTLFPTTPSLALPRAIVAGPDGAMWFIENFGATSSDGHGIGRITTGTSPSVTVSPVFGTPVDLAFDSSGALWFTAADKNIIVRTTYGKSPTVTDFSLPTDKSGPAGIALGPDGSMWFTEESRMAKKKAIGRITAGSDFSISEFPLPTPPGSSAGSIVLGPDGALWFTDVGRIGRIVVTGPSPTITEYSNLGDEGPGGFFTGAIAAGPDGALWYVSNGAIARITVPTNTLAVALSGNGQGLVTSSSLGSASLPGIACTGGNTGCTFDFPAGNQVTLTASAAPGSVFAGWSGGGCSGTGTCVMTLGADTVVTASFALIPMVTLSVTVSGTGAGVISSSPSGIACGSTCNASFDPTTAVTLTASATTGSAFQGWSGGGCSGTGTCAVILGANTAVTASFALIPTTAMLSVVRSGNGTGIVTSSPSGIACGATCNASFLLNASVTLTATATATTGSTFTGWSGGGCSGIQSCTVTLAQGTAVAANFAADSTSDITLVSALLPTSRSVQVGAHATFFGTMINAGTDTAGINCRVAPTTSTPATFFFQTTDSTTNGLIGTANTPVTIAPGAAQSFLLALTPSSAFAPTNVAFSFTCTNSTPATSSLGLNTLLLSASTTPTPDVIALVATASNDGIVDIPGASGTGAFAVATANVGAAGAITASANDGVANLPVVIMICETNPSTGQCINPTTPGSSATATIGAGATPTFAIFIQGTGSVPFQPAANRIFVQFQDAVPAGTVRGSASVAVRTQ